MMKRYFVFSGADYYPSGGMGDFGGYFDSVEDAKEKLVNLLKESEYNVSWWHIFDTHDNKIEKDGDAYALINY